MQTKTTGLKTVIIVILVNLGLIVDPYVRKLSQNLHKIFSKQKFEDFVITVIYSLNTLTAMQPS